MKRLACFPLLALMAALALPAGASTITTYVISGFEFYNQANASVTGYVTVDEGASGTVPLVDWNVVVSGVVDNNNNVVPTIDFNPSGTNATGTVSGDPLFNLLQQDPYQLTWSTLFLCSGTQVILNGTFTDPSGFTADVEGGGMMTPTPEPATWTLMGGGVLTLLGLAWRRRSATGR
jgi:hypothetical protein